MTRYASNRGHLINRVHTEYFLLENKYMYVIAFSIIRWIWNSAKCSVIGTETYNALVLHRQDPLTGHHLGNAQNQWSIAIAVI